MSAGIAGSSTGAGDRLHDHGTERGQVVRGSTGDEVAIGTTACSTTVAPALRKSVRILEKRGQGPTGHHVGLEQRPRTVAHRRHRLPGPHELPNKADGSLIDAQLVRVHCPAGSSTAS